MKNLKTIASTVALTGILALNSFAGVIITDFAGENNNTCATNTKTGVIITDFAGIFVNLTSSLTEMIVNTVDKSTKSTGCSEISKTGVIIQG